MLYDKPATGFKGLVQNWKNDLMAALSVSLVALPLALGIALASDVPAIAGVYSAIVGGMVTTFFRGSYVGINGPAAGLIAVILSGLLVLEDGTGNGFRYILGALVISGIIQTLFGLFRLGKWGNIIPSAVINGILAAVGIIIMAKQIHIALGVDTQAKSVIGILLDIPNSLLMFNPIVTILSVLCILLLFFYSTINSRLFQRIPSQLWVLVIAIPYAYFWGFQRDQEIGFIGKSVEVGPRFLIDIPNDLIEGIVFPSFSRIDSWGFWMTVLSITLISSIETLAIAKAVDKLDPYKRKTDLNKDLIGLGLGNLVCGLIGGLPIITVIVRSSVNIHNNAKTKWSNLYHSIIILLFVLILAPLMQQIPLAALAAILVFTGFKLASPKVFQNAYDQGLEQLIFLGGTLFITLYAGMLWGILGGIILTFLIHILLSGMPLGQFYRSVKKSGAILTNQEGIYGLKVQGIVNFMLINKINGLIETVPLDAQLKVNLSAAKLVDLTVLENLEDYKRKFEFMGGVFKITGLEHHMASSNHPLALKRLAKKSTNNKNI